MQDGPKLDALPNAHVGTERQEYEVRLCLEARREWRFYDKGCGMSRRMNIITGIGMTG